MGLDPNYLDSLPDTLVDMYSLVEIDILEDMARRISTYDYFIPAALHQNQKLQELGMVQEHIIQALAAMTGQTQQEIVNLLTEASERAIEDDLEYYTRADVYKPSEVNTEALHKQLNSGLLQTQQAFKNITRTTPNSGGIQFIEALDRAWTQINVGGMDYNTAVNRAIKDLAVHGLNATNSKGKLVKGAIKYNKTGHTDTLEVAVRRAIVTGANQTASKTQEALAEELGADLVEVTAHGGARPEHAKWQGKCFSRNGRKVIDGVVYEDLKKATGYGTGAGLGGWNCSHNFHPYIHGAPHTWTDKELKALEAKNITYNGKKYTEYEASQKQREIERGIRSLKRQVAAIEAGGGDASAERTKLRKAQKGYTDFTEQTGLKKQTARTQTPSVKAEKNVKKAYNTADVNTPTKKEIQQQREQAMDIQQKSEPVKANKFIPAKTTEEAETVVKSFVDENAFGALGVSYKGIDVKVANRVNETLVDLYNTYDLDKLGGVYVAKGNTKIGKMVDNAVAAYSPVRKSLILNKNALKNIEEITKSHEEEIRLIKMYADNPSSVVFKSKRAERVAKNSITSGRATVPDTIEDVINHEMGHALENAVAKSSKFSRIKENKSKYADKISGYATEDMGEYIAESFASYRKGEKLIDPDLKEVFESLEKDKSKISFDSPIEQEEKLDKIGKSGIIVTDKQFGKKIGKHAKDYKLDPSKPEDRDKMNEIIADLIVNNDYYAEGQWRGQEGTCAFYFKGDDVVIVNIDKNEFVTIMEGGVKNNAGIKKIRGEKV